MKATGGSLMRLRATSWICARSTGLGGHVPCHSTPP